jgi:hypothetical protein
MPFCGDLREVFPILEDENGGGLGVTAATSGMSATGVTGVPVFMAIDPNGNYTNLNVNSQGQLLTASGQGAGTPIRARGQLDCGYSAPTGATILVTGAQIILGNNRTVTPLSFVVSCFREAHAQLYWVDNGSDNLLEDALVGPGQYTVQIDLTGDEITTGSTGTQTLELRARNTTNYASTIRGSIVCVEL